MANNVFALKPQSENPPKDKSDSGLELLSPTFEAAIDTNARQDSEFVQLEALLDTFASVLPRYLEQLDNSIISCKNDIQEIEKKRDYFERRRKQLSLMYEAVKEREKG